MTTIIFQISDPWNLGESIGWKPFAGEIVSFKDNEDKVLIHLKKPFAVSGRAYNYVVFSSRHKGDDVRNVFEGKEIFGNGTGISDSQALSENPFADTWRGGGLAFIGTMEKLS